MLTRRKKVVHSLAVLATLVPVLASAAPGRNESRVVRLSDVSDTRLKREIAARAADQPLRDWLAGLGREAGVELRVATDYEDRPISVRAEGVPLGELLDQVAALYEDRWKSEVKGNRTAYVLEPSPARRGKQKQLLEAFESTLKRQLVDVARETAKNGPPDWLLADYGPDEREQATRELKGRGAVLSLLSPDAISQLFRGEPVRIRLAETKGAPADTLWNFAEDFAMTDAGGWKPQQRANAWVHFTADPYVLRGTAARGLPLRRLAFTFGTTTGASSAYTLVVRPDDLAAELDEKLRALREGEEQDPEERRVQGGSLLAQRVPDTQLLQQQIGRTRGAVLVALAEAVNANLIADSHIKPPVTAGALPGLMFEQALTTLSEAHDCYWRADNGMFRIRSRHWWLDDLAEPPSSAVRRWQVALETTGRLSLGDSLQIASLTDDQQGRLAAVLPESQSAFSPWLRFYGVLTATQRQTANRTEGLRLWTVADTHRHLLLNLAAGDSMLGNSATEETLHGGAAVLRVTSDPPRADAQDRRPVDSLSFAVDPVPDAAGRVHGARLRVKVTLPRRQAAGAQPAGAADGLRQEGLPRPNR